jgi:hypothetical protein
MERRVSSRNRPDGAFPALASSLRLARQVAAKAGSNRGHMQVAAPRRQSPRESQRPLRQDRTSAEAIEAPASRLEPARDRTPAPAFRNVRGRECVLKPFVDYFVSRRAPLPLLGPKPVVRLLVIHEEPSDPRPKAHSGIVAHRTKLERRAGVRRIPPAGPRCAAPRQERWAADDRLPAWQPTLRVQHGHPSVPPEADWGAPLPVVNAVPADPTPQFREKKFHARPLIG